MPSPPKLDGPEAAMAMILGIIDSARTSTPPATVRRDKILDWWADQIDEMMAEAYGETWATLKDVIDRWRVDA